MLQVWLVNKKDLREDVKEEVESMGDDSVQLATSPQSVDPLLSKNVCEVCGKNCVSKSRLANHLKVHSKKAHSDEKPFKCTIAGEGCGQSFKRMCTLVRHMKVHSFEKPFKCNQEGCEKRYKRMRDLKRHKKVHFDVKCEKQFRSKEELVGRHILVHADGELVSNMVNADEDLVKKDHPYAAEPLDNKK